MRRPCLEQVCAFLAVSEVKPDRDTESKVKQARSVVVINEFGLLTGIKPLNIYYNR